MRLIKRSENFKCKILYLLVICSFIPGAYSLYCYKCLSFECAGDESACNSARDYIVESLRPYYYISKVLPDCPALALDSDSEWLVSQYAAKACDETRETEATCSLGRIRIITKVKEHILVSHATVMGCARRELLQLVSKATIKNSCFSVTRNETEVKNPGYYHSFEMENCGSADQYCNYRDFCVSRNVSYVKHYKKDLEYLGQPQTFGYGIVIVIFAIVVILIVVIAIGSFCKNPLNRASNYSPNSPSLPHVPPTQLPNGLRRSSSSDDSENMTQNSQTDII